MWLSGDRIFKMGVAENAKSCIESMSDFCLFRDWQGGPCSGSAVSMRQGSRSRQ